MKLLCLNIVILFLYILNYYCDFYILYKYMILRKLNVTSALMALNLKSSSDTKASSSMLAMIKSFVPKLNNDLHKGQSGRIAIIGGCQEYTGAPYYAAISALRVGADLVHVFCTKDASSVIKSYSPELIVHPVIDSENNVGFVNDWLDRMHAVVLGPGLGRDPNLETFIPKIVSIIVKRNLPLIIDADGLWMIAPHLDLIKGYKRTILTPNIVEFSRLYKNLIGKEIDSNNIKREDVTEVARVMNHVSILVKGKEDIISDGINSIFVNEYGSVRRCGGQGDVLSGSIGTFAAWAHSSHTANNALFEKYGGSLCAAYAGSLLLRHCAMQTFEGRGRSMLTTDIIANIAPSFQSLYEHNIKP